MPFSSEPTQISDTPSAGRSRESEAEAALNTTAVTRGTAMMLAIVFLLTVGGVMVWQIGLDRGATLWRAVSQWVPSRAQWLPTSEQTRAAEEELRAGGPLRNWLSPQVQTRLTVWLGHGNGQVFVTNAHGLLYRPDVEYVLGPPFLAAQKRRPAFAQVSRYPDSVGAIMHFAAQLRERGIDLVVFPVPVKPTAEFGPAVNNPSFVPWVARLQAAGVAVWSPPGPRARYLKNDTHWRPETMTRAAAELAEFIRRRISLPEPAVRLPYETTPTSIDGLGDLPSLLGFTPDLRATDLEQVAVERISQEGAPWQPDRAADILLLGDSFANIYSGPLLGWGESAGLPEHLSRALDRPLDTLIRNGDAINAPREELARAPGRLTGKRLVIWEFAQRTLAIGDWKMIDLDVTKEHPSRQSAERTTVQP